MLSRVASMSQTEHVIHRVTAGFFSGEELGGREGSVGVAVSGVTADGQVDGFAHEAKHDRVLADVVAGAEGVVADFVL